MQEPSWYGVLNSTYSRLRPQLQVALTLEDEGQSSPPTTLPSQVQEMHQMHENGMARVCVLLHNVHVHVDGIHSPLCPLSLSLSLSLSHTPSLPHTVPSLSLTLDPSGGYYHLLPSPHLALKPDLHEQQLMYTLSLTLSNAKQLPNVRHNECTTTYLLDNAMSSIPY